MREELLFSHDIGDVKVNVYHCDFNKKSSFINDMFCNGMVRAIAEYLFYPYEVIAPRINFFSDVTLDITNGSLKYVMR